MSPREYTVTAMSYAPDDYELAHDLLDDAGVVAEFESVVARFLTERFAADPSDVVIGRGSLAKGMSRRSRDIGAAGSGKLLSTVVRNAVVHEAALARAMSAAGLGIDVDAFVGLLTEALSAAGRAPEPDDAASQFREDELSELTGAGLDLQSDLGHEADPASRTAAAYALLIAGSLTVSDAAERLGVDQSRIRQRLAGHTLYGLKVGRTWRLPSWQFADGADAGPAPGLDDVLPVLPSSLHPVAVWRWMTTPIPDLEHDGQATSPLAWLTAGLDPAAVANLAADL